MIDIESESSTNFSTNTDADGTNQQNSQESVDKHDFNTWLSNKVSRQSTMVSRSYGEKVIEYLRIQRESGDDCKDLKLKFTPGFRFQAKKRKFRLINVVGLGDILCLPIKDKVIIINIVSYISQEIAPN